MVARGIHQNVEHRGEVVDETQKTLKVLKQDGRIVTLIKEAYVFEFTLPGNERVVVEGSLLVGRPEDRLKKRLRRW